MAYPDEWERMEDDLVRDLESFRDEQDNAH
jgi:hypothetical protein